MCGSMQIKINLSFYWQSLAEQEKNEWNNFEMQKHLCIRLDALKERQ